jgi:Domain of unknown function (DUF4166)
MSHQRAQRVAMEWAVALANMRIPDELRRVSAKASPQSDHGLADDSLGDLRFRALLSDAEWASLPPPVRRRFSKRLAGGRTAVYTGEILETRMTNVGWCLAQLARLIGGPLPTSREAKMPSVVTVTEDMATGGQIWTRLYARRNGFPQIIHSSKRFAGPTGIEEYLGRGFGMALGISVRNGALAFRSEHYFLQIFGRRLRLPRWLSPGEMIVTHVERGGGRFEFVLQVKHPRFGLMILQSAAFRESAS